MKKSKWVVLPIIVLVIAGIFVMACNDEAANNGGNTGGKVSGITLKVMNGNAQEAAVLPKQLPPGARVVVDAVVERTGSANKNFTVSVDIPSALQGKITETVFDAETYPGAKQIQVAQDAAINMNVREWVTVTVTSAGDKSIKAEWKFVVWGNSVTPAASFNVNDAALGKLPNLTVAPGDVYEDSVPMSNRYRLVGYPVAVFRADTTKSALDNECDEYNGMGYISGDDMEMLRNAPPGSLVRLYFSYTRAQPNSDNTAMELDSAGRNGWGVLKFGNDGLELKAPNGNATFYVDASVDNALEAMAANQQTELFVNVYNSSLLKMELWEQIKPITWTNKGVILQQTTGATITLSSTGTYAEQHALIRACKEGSYMRITMESPEFQSGWGVAQIGGSASNQFFTVNVPDSRVAIDSGWVRFTINMDLWTMLRSSNFSMPLAETNSIRFNVWNMNVTGINGDSLSGTPRFVEVELFSIDD